MDYIQKCYLSAATTIVAVNCFSTRFIAYGPRSASDVPHGYFAHFYIVSVASSLFWAVQFMSNGKLLRQICADVQMIDGAGSMSMEQIELAWTLLLVQGIRRQLETARLTRPSLSKMWFVHYIAGIAFYLGMGISIWIEGIGTLSQQSNLRSAITFSPPSLRTIVSMPLFILSSGMQHDCHTYLASLPKYTLPIHPLFNLLISPHYTAECLIYLSLAVLAAPEGMWVNRTVFAAFLFVTANLSVTASGTRAWYKSKFGKDSVKGKWTMFPGLW